MNAFAHGGMVMNDWGYGYGYSIVGWITTVVTIVIIVFGILLVVRSVNRDKRGGGEHVETALDILNKRYAGGEIDKKEYEEKKKDLS